MRPVFQIRVNGLDITRQVNERLIDLRIDDNAGIENDSLNLTLDAKRPHIQIPPRGAVIEVQLGYLKAENMRQPAPMSYMGSFIYDEVEVEKSKSGGTTLVISAHAINSADPWKEPKTVSYHDTTLRKIFEEAVARHPGYTLSIEGELGDIVIRNFEQNSLSDIAMIQKLGLKYGANVKVFDKRVYVARPGTVQRFADTIREDDCQSYYWLTQGRSLHRAVRARSWNKDTGVMQTALAETKEPNAQAVYELPKVYPTIEDAQEAAQAQAISLAKSRDVFTFTLFHGNPLLLAEMLLRCDGPGFYAEMPRLWNIAKVTHSFSKSGGFTTSGHCELPRRDGDDPTE